jgi:hypothetical protein
LLEVIMPDKLPSVRVPGDAVDAEGDDVLAPAIAILEALHLRPTEAELNQAGGPGAVLGGPSQSVAVIEAGATALSKWWAVGLGAAVVAGWSSIVAFWNSEGDATQRIVVVAAAVASAAIILGIAFIVGSDVRARAAAAVATIEARVHITETVVRVAQARPQATDPRGAMPIASLPKTISVKYLRKPGEDEAGWTALALRPEADGSGMSFFIAKEDEFVWVPTTDLHFGT